MLLRCVAAFAAAAKFASAQQACTNCTNESPEPIELVPAPWTLKGDMYGSFLLPGAGVPLFANSDSLPKKAFPPLERQYPEAIAGEYTGRLGMLQVIRYTETPVGPYDELLIIPGFFGFEDNGKRQEMTRVSRIYVSQKYTAWNGRKSEYLSLIMSTTKIEVLKHPQTGTSPNTSPASTGPTATTAPPQ